jgi:hypothetical protein
MKWTFTLAATAISLVSLTAGADPSVADIESKSPDVLQHRRAGKAPARVLAPLTAGGVAAAAGPTIEDVGDPDSFGRNVTYIGMTQTDSVTLAEDCTGSDPEFDRCVIRNPPPATTSFNEADLATINLPARATKSLICFAITPFIGVSWTNPTASMQTAGFSATAPIIIDNEVLNDPALIDPATGLPFGGSLRLSLSTWHNQHSIGAGEFESENSFQSRSCIAGIVSKNALVQNYGLTDAQATQFFRKPMTLHFGARGFVQSSDFTQYFYGIRLYGD